MPPLPFPYFIIIIIIIIIINLNEFTLCDSVLQYNNTSHKITYNTQDNPQYAKLQKNQDHILYTIKIPKRVEPEVDEPH
jgi:hypothetical protein